MGVAIRGGLPAYSVVLCFGQRRTVRTRAFQFTAKYLFLPFSESDFIFSVIGEELGLFGCVMVIAAYMVIIYRAVRIAKNSNDRFGCYLSAGIADIIAIQTAINIAVVSGSILRRGCRYPSSAPEPALSLFSVPVSECF